MKRKAKFPFDPKAFLSKVNGGRAIADYQKDQNIYKQGDPADFVFYIRSGKVKKTVVSEQGKEAVVALLGTGNFFGEGCLTGQPLRLSTVSAMTECVIVRVTKADITRVIHEEPAFAELFIAHLLARNSRVEEDLVSNEGGVRRRKAPMTELWILAAIMIAFLVCGVILTSRSTKRPTKNH